MNFNLYLFGKNKGKFNQYPNDYTSSIFADICSEIATSKSLIVRNQDLMHYIYAENLGNHNVIGVCLIFNKAYVKHVSKLFDFLRELIESTLLKQGKIIRYNEQGDIEFSSNNLSEDITLYKYVKNLIDSKLDSDNNYFGVSELTTTFNGLQNSVIVDGNTTNTEIIKIQQKVNKITIEYNKGIEDDLTKKVITRLQAHIVTLEKKIADQEKTITKLEKTRKQYKKVLFLVFVLLCACVGLYYLHDNLNNTLDQLDYANNTISEKESIIVEKDAAITSLRESVSSLEYNLDRETTAKEKIESSLQKVCSYSPFVVTSSDVTSTRFKFDYYSLKEKEITVTLKAINEKNNEIITGTHTLTFYKGSGTKSLDFYRKLDPSQYYYVVLIYDGYIVAGQRW